MARKTKDGLSDITAVTEPGAEKGLSGSGVLELLLKIWGNWRTAATERHDGGGISGNRAASPPS